MSLLCGPSTSGTMRNEEVLWFPSRQRWSGIPSGAYLYWGRASWTSGTTGVVMEGGKRRDMKPSFVKSPAFRAIVVVQGLLQIAAMVDLFQQKKLRRGPKWVWALIIPTFGYGGPIAYWLLARPTESQR